MTQVITAKEKKSLYDVLLTKEERRLLQQVRKSSRQLFDVGDIAASAFQRAQEKGIPAYVVYTLVGEEAGIGWRRASKLAMIADRFPPKVRNQYSGFPFSYFEEAFLFPPGEDRKMLEYAAEQMDETSRWPGADRLADDFRRVALGHDTSATPPEKSGSNGRDKTVVLTSDRQHDVAAPGSRIEVEWVKASTLRALIAGWRKDRNTTVNKVIKDIEKELHR